MTEVQQALQSLTNPDALARRSTLEEFETYLAKQEVNTDQDAANANDLLLAIKAEEKRLDGLRVADKAPHLAAGKAVDDAYRPVLSFLERSKRKLEGFLGAWTRKKQAEEARRLAEAEKERQRLEKQLQAAIKKGKDTTEIEKAAAPVREALMAPITEGVRSEFGSTRVTEKEFVRIVDIKLVPRDLLELAAIQDLERSESKITTLTKLALKRIQAGVAVPGVELDSKPQIRSVPAGRTSGRGLLD